MDALLVLDILMRMGEKRVATTPGIGAVRGQSGEGRRPGPITCPSLKIPKVENLASREVEAAKRDTLKRAASSDTAVPTARVIMTMSPRPTGIAATFALDEIHPKDAFLLTRLDGELCVADLADLTGMAPKDVVASVERLMRAGLVER